MANPTTQALVGTMILSAVPLVAAMATEDAGDAILGQWLTADGEGRVLIEESDGVYSGKIVWLMEPNYPAGDAEAGEPKRDRLNPDKTKRHAGPSDLNVLEGFRYVGKQTWTGGTVYDPRDGKTYRGKLTLKGKQQLNVRGYRGLSFFGRTKTWTRCQVAPAEEAEDRSAEASASPLPPRVGGNPRHDPAGADVAGTEE